MSTQVQRRKGTTAQHASFTGASAELTVDTTKNTVVVHDGATAGGIPLAKETGSAISATSLTSSGASVISVTDNTNAALRIIQLGTGNALLIEDSANPDSSPVLVDSTGNLISGYTTQFPTALATASQVGIGGVTSTSGGGVSILKYRNISTVGPDLEFVKSRSSTIGVNSTVTNADLLGTITWSGADGTGYVQAASISAAVDGTPGTNDMPGRLVFSTTADGASSPTEAMRLTSSLLTVVPGATIQGVTVGRGAGAISTNTAVGASALAANTTGANGVAIGYEALKANTTSNNLTAVGYQAALTGITARGITAFGYRALATNTADKNTAFGGQALQNNSTGTRNAAFGGAITGASDAALGKNTIGDDNTAMGNEALSQNTTGSRNTSLGANALYFSVTPSNNTSIGCESMYGVGAGASTGNNTTAVGYRAGYAITSGNGNQFFGYTSGSAVTTGAKNVILGSYTGSAAPISATGSNFIVLSDGDGNVRQFFNGANATFNGTITPQQATTAAAPTYVKGAMYFDTTLNKLRIGGATGWETVTSV